MLRKEAVERGTMQIKKPARMRWTYEAPERKVFVADGTRIYSYIPEDRQVLWRRSRRRPRRPPRRCFSPVTAASLGISKRPSRRSPIPRPGRTHSNWSRTAGKPSTDWLVLVVDRGTYRLRKLITADAQGGQSTFTFSDVRENMGIPDSAFRFTIPRGVDVVTHEQVRR